MKKKYKLVKKIDKVIRKIEIDNNIEITKAVIPIATIGVATIIGSTILIASSHVKEAPNETVHNYSERQLIEEEYTPNELTIDFANYDLSCIDKFASNVGSLYDAEDVTLYREKYQDIITEKAGKWGIDPNLAMAILTQESRSGKTTNLMQIEFGVWQGVPFRVYDFEKEQYVDILLTNDPDLYQSNKYLTINENDLENPMTNISIGCAMIQKSMDYMKYNAMVGTQCYNYGPSTMNNKIIPKTLEQNSLSRDEMLDDQFNLDFISNTSEYALGDNDYACNVARFLNPKYESICICEHTEAGENIYHLFEYQKLLKEYEQYKTDNIIPKL